MKRWILVSAATLLVATQLSCATGGLTPEQHSMPAERAALQPEYRIFYDSLRDYGDWVLVEPYGFLFRPRVALASWRPYSDGFWVPTDAYGWVWASTEPFGWATYHYGRWVVDPYQGWLWRPGGDWAPAWVDWRASDGYVGWAPLQPSGAAPAATAYNYVRVNDLASPDLEGKIVKASEIAAEAQSARPVENIAETDGVVFNRGPRMNWVERQTGPLFLTEIQDLVSSPPRASDPAPGEERPDGPSTPATLSPDSVALMKRAAAEATREARYSEDGLHLPTRVHLVRPLGVPRPPEPAPKAAGDSTRILKPLRVTPLGTAKRDTTSR